MNEAIIDAFVVSYPKCGRTWLRMMLGTSINEAYQLGLRVEELTEIRSMTKKHPDVPVIRFTHDNRAHTKTFDELGQKVANRYSNILVILLVRDPRDVVISYYYQYKFRGDKYAARDDGFDKSLDDFMFYDIGGIRHIVHFYNRWSDWVSKKSNCTVIRFEEMLTRPNEVLQEVVEFTGLNKVTIDNIEHAVEMCKYERLKKLEKRGVLNSKRYGGKNENERKVRKGGASDWKSKLSRDTARNVEQYICSKLSDKFSFYKYNSFNEGTL
ncbi:sulfotransferase domain-containing protein [Salinibacter ruber]|uniref:sulfotransferase domain-containing protein n=1 Tax=Salinibacter ruber TaxID=146919 RepID=UPI00160BABCE|nr:hypothetical protein [Salinibacter ruber]